MELEKIIEFAKENGYDSARKFKDWKGYEAYEPIVDESEDFLSGLPFMILVKGDEIRMSTPEEALEQATEE